MIAQTKDGVEIDLLLNASPTPDDAGGIIGVLCIGQAATPNTRTKLADATQRTRARTQRVHTHSHTHARADADAPVPFLDFHCYV